VAKGVVKNIKKTPKDVDERPASVINHWQGAGQRPKNDVKTTPKTAKKKLAK
jgi:hypothetical protein